TPPLKLILEFDGMIWWGKNNRTGDQVLRRRSRIILHARLSFSNRHISSVFHEACELFVGYFGPVHPETVNVDTMPRTSIVHVILSRTHPKLTARHPHHSAGTWPRRLCVVDVGDPRSRASGMNLGTNAVIAVEGVSHGSVRSLS